MQSKYENLKNKFKILLEKIFLKARYSFYGRADISHIINDNELKSLSEYIDLKNEIYKYPEITLHFDKYVSITGILGETSCFAIVKTFLNWCVQNKNEFMENDFLNKFQSFLEFFNSDTIEAIKECKLFNFDATFKDIAFSEINFDNELSIKKIRIKSPDLGFQSYLHIHYEYKIFHKKKIKKILESRLDENTPQELKEFVSNDKVIENVIKAIHISKRSKCFRDSNTEISYSGFLRKLTGSVVTVRPFKPAIHGRESFNAEEINSFKKIWEKLKQTDKRGHISSNRLLYASEKTNSDDKLLDYFVGLESLFLPDSDSELNFRLSLRVAKILESDSSRQKEVFNFMKKMYGKRSNIVHGKNKEIFNEDLQKLETILRKSIHMYLDCKEQFKEENLNKILF